MDTLLEKLEAFFKSCDDLPNENFQWPVVDEKTDNYTRAYLDLRKHFEELKKPA